MSKFRRSKESMRPSMDCNNNNSNNTKNCSTERNVSRTKVMPHDEFIKRVQKSLYYGSSQMSIPLSDYMSDRFSDTHKGYSLNRLHYDTVGQLKTTPYSLILALIYLERLKETDPAYTKHITPTELFIVSMLVSTKFYNGYDEDVTLSDWAEYGNLTNDQLKIIELEFLAALNWNLYVSNEEFFRKFYSLEMILARKQGLHRGWFTYMELNHLLPSITIVKSFIQYTLVLAMGYAAFVATIAGSILLVSQVPGTSLYASTHSPTATATAGAASSTSVQTGSTTDSSNSIHGKTEPPTMADEIAELALDIDEQLSIMDATMKNSEQRSKVPLYKCDRQFDRHRMQNDSSTHLLPPSAACSPIYSFIFTEEFNLQRNTDSTATVTSTGDKRTDGANKIRTGFNLKTFLFGSDDDHYAFQRRNRTGYDRLMSLEHHRISAEISSCSKHDVGLVVHWRKVVEV